MSMKSMITAALLLTACSQSNAESASGAHQSAAQDAAEQKASNTDQAAANSSPNTLNTIPANAVFAVSGLPVASSDQSEFTMAVTADPRITYFSYKVGTPQDCLNSTGYQVLPINSEPKISVPSDASGQFALCILRYYAPTKLWQTVANATVISWEKVVFHRMIQAQYVEYDETCDADIKTQTSIEFNGTLGTYKWTRDARSQGCDEDTESGEDKMTIEENTLDAIKGYWAYDGTSTSGWYKFTWSNADRTAFTGVFGYGDPNLEPAGAWNSIP